MAVRQQSQDELRAMFIFGSELREPVMTTTANATGSLPNAADDEESIVAGAVAANAASAGIGGMQVVLEEVVLATGEEGRCRLPSGLDHVDFLMGSATARFSTFVDDFEDDPENVQQIIAEMADRAEDVEEIIVDPFRAVSDSSGGSEQEDDEETDDDEPVTLTRKFIVPPSHHVV
eukprot:ANDGO_08584.mRNA.1 hypothetical protein